MRTSSPFGRWLLLASIAAAPLALAAAPSLHSSSGPAIQQLAAGPGSMLIHARRQDNRGRWITAVGAQVAIFLEGRIVRTGVTDSNGMVEFNGIPLGRYRIEGSFDGGRCWGTKNLQLNPRKPRDSTEVRLPLRRR